MRNPQSYNGMPSYCVRPSIGINPTFIQYAFVASQQALHNICQFPCSNAGDEPRPDHLSKVQGQRELCGRKSRFGPRPLWVWFDHKKTAPLGNV
eukprot:3805595-Amphidinium_carterae.1